MSDWCLCIFSVFGDGRDIVSLLRALPICLVTYSILQISCVDAQRCFAAL